MMIAGSGKRPSMLIVGGVTFAFDSVTDRFFALPCPFPTMGAKRCVRLAYDSRVFGGGRGCSIGKNMKAAC